MSTKSSSVTAGSHARSHKTSRKTTPEKAERFHNISRNVSRKSTPVHNIEMTNIEKSNAGSVHTMSTQTEMTEKAANHVGSIHTVTASTISSTSMSHHAGSFSRRTANNSESITTVTSTGSTSSFVMAQPQRAELMHTTNTEEIESYPDPLLSEYVGIVGSLSEMSVANHSANTALQDLKAKQYGGVLQELVLSPRFPDAYDDMSIASKATFEASSSIFTNTPRTGKSLMLDDDDISDVTSNHGPIDFGSIGTNSVLTDTADLHRLTSDLQRISSDFQRLPSDFSARQRASSTLSTRQRVSSLSTRQKVSSTPHQMADTGSFNVCLEDIDSYGSFNPTTMTPSDGMLLRGSNIEDSHAEESELQLSEILKAGTPLSRNRSVSQHTEPGGDTIERGASYSLERSFDDNDSSTEDNSNSKQAKIHWKVYASLGTKDLSQSHIEIIWTTYRRADKLGEFIGKSDLKKLLNDWIDSLQIAPEVVLDFQKTLRERSIRMIHYLDTDLTSRIKKLQFKRISEIGLWEEITHEVKIDPEEEWRNMWLGIFSDLDHNGHLSLINIHALWTRYEVDNQMDIDEFEMMLNHWATSLSYHYPGAELNINQTTIRARAAVGKNFLDLNQDGVIQWTEFIEIQNSEFWRVVDFDVPENLTLGRGKHTRKNLSIVSLDMQSDVSDEDDDLFDFR